jgi:hypothetical protein
VRVLGRSLRLTFRQEKEKGEKKKQWNHTRIDLHQRALGGKFAIRTADGKLHFATGIERRNFDLRAALSRTQ